MEKGIKTDIRGKVSRVFERVCVLSLIIFVMTIGSTAVTAMAAETADSDSAVRKGDDGYYHYYYSDGSIVEETGWVQVGFKIKILLDDKYRVIYRIDGNTYKYPGKTDYEFVGDYIYKFDSKTQELAALSDVVVRLDDGQAYYVNKDGGIFSSVNTDKSNGKGTIYLLRTCTTCGDNRDSVRSVVKGKLVKQNNVLRYYDYEARTNRWYMAKNVYKNISGITYYFNNNGAAIHKIVTGTGKGKSEKLYVNRNNKWQLVQNRLASFPTEITRLDAYSLCDGTLEKWNSKTMTSVRIPNRASAKNNRLYFFIGDGTKAIVSKWYNAADGTKVFVSSKGYVTKRYSPKTKMEYSYNYSQRKWVAITGKSYTDKIGLTTYYFGKNGRAYKTYRVKCNHIWYENNYYKKNRMICNNCGKDETDIGSRNHELASGVYFFKGSEDYYWWGNKCPVSWHEEGATISIRWICDRCDSTILIEGTRKPTARDY